MEQDVRPGRVARLAAAAALAIAALAAGAAAQDKPQNTMEEAHPDAALDAARADARVPDPDPIPPAFRPAVALAERTGLTVSSFVEHQTDSGRYVAVIYAFPESAGEKAGTKSLKLYFQRSGSSAVSATDLYEEAVIGFGTYEDESTVFADVNGDGVTEFIVSAANGGNCWACSTVRLYALGGPTPRLLVAEPMTMQDLNGDGTLELLVGDARWESYDDFSHAAAPGGTLVYTWRDGTYVFAGSDVKAFYEKELDRYRGYLAEAIASINAADDRSDESYLGLALSMYIARVYMDDVGRGEEELRRMMVDNAPNAQMRSRRQRIMEDFLAGESSRLLREPRKGDPIGRPENRLR